MGGASAAAGAPPLKMSSRPSPPAAGPGALGPGAEGGPPRRSKRSPPPPPPAPPVVGGTPPAGGPADGPSSKSFKSSRSFAPPPIIGPGPLPAPLGTPSMVESPTARVSAPPISLSFTGILSRIPARWASHSELSSSRNSQLRCCKSTCRDPSKRRSSLRMRSNSLGQRVTSLIRAAETRQCVAGAFSAHGGFRTTSCSKSKTSPAVTWMGWSSGPTALPETKWSPNSPRHHTPTCTKASCVRLSFMLK
mmetsp:Transcript_102477/g.244318  ORF Transcript_102477/g.244318 Transcript_102477/m.244318 type:complete len:249 (+) Transcript_102477:235-981(+)